MTVSPQERLVDKWPQPFWAVLLAFMGVALAGAVLFHHGDVNIALAVLGIGSNLVSGALGGFAGHATPKADVTTTSGAVTIGEKSI